MPPWRATWSITAHRCPSSVAGLGGSPGRVMVHTFMEATPEEMSSRIWAMWSGGLTPLNTQWKAKSM